ncbi:hypothetical protein B0H14DRAFT_1013741 [Mycena olivaceomarginata]|nr:hypothetical protein B0H14DRAFT_1013741 [Mycena olivaceomarginata]
MASTRGTLCSLPTLFGVVNVQLVFVPLRFPFFFSRVLFPLPSFCFPFYSIWACDGRCQPNFHSIRSMGAIIFEFLARFPVSSILPYLGASFLGYRRVFSYATSRRYR